MEEQGFHILNKGNIPTFYTVRGDRIFQSSVDITACSEDLLVLVEDWKVEEGITSSDHNTISYKIELNNDENNSKPKTTRIYNTSKADCNKMKEEFSKDVESRGININNVAHIYNKEKLANIINKYLGSVKTACDKSIPLIINKKSKHKNNLPWWSAELEMM